jgi:hypothetical protein
MVPRGSFYSPKGPRSRWSFIWKLPAFLYSWVHWPVQCTPDNSCATVTKSLIGRFPSRVSTRLSSDPPSRWSLLAWPNSRWPPITPDCLVLSPDCQVNFSRWGPTKAEAEQFGHTTAGLFGAHRTVWWVALDCTVLPRPAHFLIFCAKLLWLLLAWLEMIPST